MEQVGPPLKEGPRSARHALLRANATCGDGVLSTESSSAAAAGLLERFPRQLGSLAFSFCVPPSYILGLQSVGPPPTCSSTPPKCFFEPLFVWGFQKMGSLAHNGRFVSHVQLGLGRHRPKLARPTSAATGIDAQRLGRREKGNDACVQMSFPLHFWLRGPVELIIFHLAICFHSTTFFA